ncbi:MAG: BatD family protein, partial [candidate division Zixibacteria bacterium]
TGFWTELLGNKAPYYQTINGRNYRVIERKYALFPTQTGELTIGRAMISTTIAAKSRRFRDPFDVFGDVFGRGEEVVIRSSPVTINVRSLPAEGRPKDFTGTIGNFRISATPNKTQVEVNQPVSVTIKISGTGNVKSAAEPPMPPLDDFRIYQASASENISKQNDRIGGTKIYEEVFIPKRPGQLEIPALTFNFFNPDRDRYETISTQPIMLNVTKPEGYVASPQVPFAGPDMTISSQAHDIRYIKDNPGDFYLIGRLIIFSPAYVVVNGLPVLVLAVMVALRRRREKLAGDIGYARARTASRMARKRLARARSQARADMAGEFFTEIYSALISYVADKVNTSPHGLTTDRLKQLLAENAVEDSVVAKVVQLMQSCDFARYAPSAISQESIDKALVEAEEIMVFLEGVRFEK